MRLKTELLSVFVCGPGAHRCSMPRAGHIGNRHLIRVGCLSGGYNDENENLSKVLLRFPVAFRGFLTDT